MNNKIAEFLGWYFGDGCLSITKDHYEFSITGDLQEEISFYEQVVLPTFNELFEDKLKVKAKLRKYPSVGVCGIYIFDKTTVTYIKEAFGLLGGKKLNVKIPLFETSDQKRHFLRGLYDTDGSIYRK